jgi:hypothetical protein
LLRLSTGESVSAAVPHAVEQDVVILWGMGRALLRNDATAEETVRLVHDLYVRMEELFAPRAEMSGTGRAEENGNVGTSSSASQGELYRPIPNWDYRGAMHPEFIKNNQEQDGQIAEQEHEPRRLADPGSGSGPRPESAPGVKRGEDPPASKSVVDSGRSFPTRVEELLALEIDDRVVAEATSENERTVRYPEWDHRIQDYRANWCLVVERPADAGSDECVDSTLTAHRSRIKSLRRFFETLRPPAFRRVVGQVDGEDLDIDAVVRRAAALHAGHEEGDRLFIRHEKKERDVAVAFVVDISGSTGRQLENGRRVIDIEKESLVLLCESLEAAGDPYGLYAYSGQGRSCVEFYTIKDFDERLGATTAHRLGGLGPRRQNRDGAAIRHAVAKLKTREEKTRIVFLLSDGRPLDHEYKDEYALEDTKAALREAKRSGIDAFCVTIDREADEYLRRMYGDVGFTVIDRVELLPAKLPRIYQRLTT